MKRVTVGLCLALILAASGALMARGDQDFTLVNKTGLTITEFYVSPANDNHWGEDVLGKDVLDNGESVEIKFHRDEDECSWDLKIVDKAKNEVIWEDIDLCKASEITLKDEGKRATALIK